MDIVDLFQSCKRGDLNRVQYLHNQREVDLNQRDMWDSTPLYYACLCGHEDTVKYLLHNGAKCEANTFDGERCLYGSLNDDIKRLLKSYKAITTTTIKRDVYNEFLRRVQERGCHSDISFEVGSKLFPAHRCILSARSKYFADKFRDKWSDRSVIVLNSKHGSFGYLRNIFSISWSPLESLQWMALGQPLQAFQGTQETLEVQPWALQAILQYIYTSRLDAHVDQVTDIMRLAKQCELYQLIFALEDRIKKVFRFESTKPGVNVTMICIEPLFNDSSLQKNLAMLADLALPADFCSDVVAELPFPPKEVRVFPDVIFSVEEKHFMCHKQCCKLDFLMRPTPGGLIYGGMEIWKMVFFCERSDYFKALVEDHFGESSTEGQLPVITLHGLSCRTFAQVLYYIYQDSPEELTPENVYDVLCMADMYLLPGLKRQCANVIGQFLDVDTIVSILRTARMFNLVRLEDQCAEFLASNIEKMVEMPEFGEFVMEDAKSVIGRQETDTIPIIDDIRFHITSFMQTFSDIFEANQKLTLIGNFLEELGLDG